MSRRPLSKTSEGARDRKSERITLRVTAEQKEILHKAAGVEQSTMTTFILQKSYAAAQQVLTEQHRFVLNSEMWEAFTRALDRPARVIRPLQKLLTEPGVLDD